MKITMNEVGYTYGAGTPFEKTALFDVNLALKEKELVGLIGHTGSGKSTLVQLFAGLLKPTAGDVVVGEINTKDKLAIKKGLRSLVGMVFQYPEHQLFEETVYKDIAFGPKNLGLDEAEVEKRVRYGMELVGLDFERYKDLSPFDLSGGQKRRVAIAGVLAMRPDFLILDEPTAGLDPQGRKEILGEIKEIYRNYDVTIILVTHSMEDIARLASRIIVIDEGRVVMDDTPEHVFTHADELEAMGLDIPMPLTVIRALRQKGWDLPDALTVEEAYAAIKEAMEVRRA